MRVILLETYSGTCALDSRKTSLSQTSSAREWFHIRGNCQIGPWLSPATNEHTISATKQLSVSIHSSIHSLPLTLRTRTTQLKLRPLSSLIYLLVLADVAHFLSSLEVFIEGCGARGPLWLSSPGHIRPSFLPFALTHHFFSIASFLLLLRYSTSAAVY